MRDGMADSVCQILACEPALLVAQTIANEMISGPGRTELLVGTEATHQESPGFPAYFTVHQAGDVFA
jgi:hypothetical protein